MDAIEAADHLGVTRSYLIQLIHTNKIEGTIVNGHWHLNAESVEDFRHARLLRQRAAFDDLRDLLDD
jgi:excisionase family DNA binding protein